MTSRTIGARNPRLRRLRQLVTQTKVRSQERAFVVDGPRLVLDAIDAGLEVQEVFAAPGMDDDLGLGDRLERLSDRVDRYEVAAELLSSVLDPKSPRPIAAVCARPEPDRSRLDRAGHLVVAVELRDPGNLGTVIRTAEASGAVGVALVGDSVDPWSPKVVRASAGSVFRSPPIRWSDAGQAITDLRAGGRPVVATVVEPGAVSYDRVDLTGAAILIGNEPRGLDRAVVEAADHAVTIPLVAAVESLNVAAAAAVLCFEAARQRRGAVSS